MKAAKKTPSIKLYEVVNLIQEHEQELDRLRSKLAEYEQYYVDTRLFARSKLSCAAVAALHNVSNTTVARRVEEGSIPAHTESTSGKFLIAADIALLLDFNNLRKFAQARLEAKLHQ